EERANAASTLADAERTFRGSQLDRSSAERSYRESVERQGVARERVSQQAGSAARIVALDEELKRVEQGLSRVIGELHASERDIEVAEADFRSKEEERRRIEEERRRIGEDAAGRRAEVDALQRSLTAAEHERGRIVTSLAGIDDADAKIDLERESLAAE